METYHKIQTLFKREQSGPKKGRMIPDDWTTPELAYLADNQWEFTEKVDGTNIRVEHRTGYEWPKFAGRTDRADIPAPLLDHLENTFSRSLFEKAGFGGAMAPHILLFGEGYGPK